MKFLFICLSLSFWGGVSFLLTGCTSEKTHKNNLTHFNVSATYSEKEIKLEEVADIEYLQLEFDDDFLYNEPPVIITSEKIIAINHFNGDILVFSRVGEPLSKFNRRGNGPEDYPNIDRLIFDEQSDEFFVKTGNKIAVYSTSGDFKRTISLFEGAYFINEIVNNDSNTLLLYDDYNVYPTPFSLISKTDGSVVGTVDIPKDKKINILFSQTIENNVFTLRAPAYRIVRHNDGFLLTDFSIDTVYFFSRNRALSPVLVRKPFIQLMNPVIYLNSFVETENYQFVSTITVKNENNQLPRMYLMRDKKTDKVYKQKITFNDYQGRVVTLSPETIANTQDSKLGLIVLSLVELQDANSENKLSGRLKELVDNSDEDGNNIYILLHFK